MEVVDSGSVGAGLEAVALVVAMAASVEMGAVVKVAAAGA